MVPAKTEKRRGQYNDREAQKLFSSFLFEQSWLERKRAGSSSNWVASRCSNLHSHSMDIAPPLYFASIFFFFVELHRRRKEEAIIRSAHSASYHAPEIHKWPFSRCIALDIDR